MENRKFYNWDVRTGDYLRDEEYDKLYLRNKKHEKAVKIASLIGAAAVVAGLYFVIMETLIKF